MERKVWQFTLPDLERFSAISWIFFSLFPQLSAIKIYIWVILEPLHINN